MLAPAIQLATLIVKMDSFILLTDCPAGYTHNLVGFGRFYDCALPETFLNTYFIVFTVFYVPGMVIFLPLFVLAVKDKLTRGHPPSKMHSLGLTSYLSAFWAWMLVLNTYLDGGSYFRSQIFFLLMSCSGTWSRVL
jgi:hypothetical protein